MKYQNILNKGIKILNKSEDKNWIIIGDNSIGKSELLRKYVSEYEDGYYIDSVNRVFDISKIAFEIPMDVNITSKQIRDKRVTDEFYNLKDSFAGYGNIERLYPIYRDKLIELLKKYIGIEFSIEREGYVEGYGEGRIMCKINNLEVELSSGYQAIIRIFSELIFYNDYLKERGTIVIDEIDEFLSPKNSASILEFLKNEFQQNSFIVSTHSGDLIANSSDINIIALERENFSILDGNDFSTLTEVNTLFYKLFDYEQKKNCDIIDSKLQKLFNLKITGNWSGEEEIEFKSIDKEILTPVQKLIYKQIKEW